MQTASQTKNRHHLLRIDTMGGFTKSLFSGPESASTKQQPTDRQGGSVSRSIHTTGNRTVQANSATEC